MVGHRKTHHYPHGKPHPLVWLEVGMAVVALSWVFLVPGHWLRAVVILAVFVALAVISTKLHSHYERTGQAVRIPRPRVAVKFPKGLPVPMLAARAGFFVVGGIMLLLGVVPFKDSIARAGVIACVFALIVVAVLNLSLEHHYARSGHATEVDLTER
jgi:hypothetical protein